MHLLSGELDQAFETVESRGISSLTQANGFFKQIANKDRDKKSLCSCLVVLRQDGIVKSANAKKPLSIEKLTVSKSYQESFS